MCLGALISYCPLSRCHLNHTLMNTLCSKQLCFHSSTHEHCECEGVCPMYLFLHNSSGHSFASSHIQIWQLVTIHKHCLKYPNIFLVASSLLAQQSICPLISTEAHIIEKAIDGVRIHSITAECSKRWNISAWLQADYQPHLKTLKTIEDDGDDGNVYPTSLNSTWMMFKSVER